MSSLIDAIYNILNFIVIFRCICTDDGFSGEFCETCETCQSVCQELRPCAECAYFAKGDLIPNGISEETVRQVSANCSSGQTDECPYKFWEEEVEAIPVEWPNCTFKLNG